MSRWEVTPQKSSLEAAAEAAAKVNAMLIAKGKLKPSQVSQPTVVKYKPQQASVAGNPPVAEIDINDIHPGCRNMLTRGVTQDEISKMSGAAVSTRGRYMSPQDMADNPNERPIYLFIQGKTQESVDKAVGRISEIISTFKPKNRFSVASSRVAIPPPVVAPRVPPPSLMTMNPPPGLTLLQDKVVVGLEHAPPSFNVKEKVEGPGGNYLQHIATESGAKVSLRGRGSGNLESALGAEAFEPMFIMLQHPLMSGLQQAKQLTENLLQTVHQEYVQFQQALAAMPPSLNTGQVLTVQPQSVVLGQPPPGIPQGSVLTTVPQPIPEQVVGPPGTVELRALPGPPGQVQQVTLQPGQVQIQAQPVTMPPGPQQVTLQLQAGPPVPGTVGATVAGVPQTILSQPGIVQPQLVNPPGSVAVAGSVSQPVIQQASVPVASITGAVQPAVAIVTSQPLETVPVDARLQGQQDNGPQLVSALPANAVVTGQPQVIQAGQPVLAQPVPGPQPVPGAEPVPAQPNTSLGQPSAQSYYQKYINQPTEDGAAANGGQTQAHKRRFTEEKKEEKVPENILGYQHGPPHLANLVNNKEQAEKSENEKESRSGEEKKDVSLIPPPPSSKDDKNLMPPPKIPGNENVDEPLKKKAKGPLSNTGVSEDEPENDTIKSTFKEQQEEASKYSFNQYSSKAQLYVPPDQPITENSFANQPTQEVYQIEVQARPEPPIAANQGPIQGEQIHQLHQPGQIIQEHPQQVVPAVPELLANQALQAPPPMVATVVPQEGPPQLVTQQTVVFTSTAPPTSGHQSLEMLQPNALDSIRQHEPALPPQIHGPPTVLVAEGSLQPSSLAVAGYSIAPPLTSGPPPVYSVAVAPPQASEAVAVYSVAPPLVSEPLSTYSASVAAVQTSQPAPSYSVAVAPPAPTSEPPSYSISVAQSADRQPAYSVASSQAQQPVSSQQSDTILYQPPSYPTQSNQMQQPPPSTTNPPPPPPPANSTTRNDPPPSLFSAPPPPPPPQENIVYNAYPRERPPFQQQPQQFGAFPPNSTGYIPNNFPYWQPPPPPPPT